MRFRSSCAILALLSPSLTLAEVPDAAMLRTPDVSATHIVFRYADDLWTVPRAGGEARPLASPDGAEWDPKWSPDGARVAFMANYQGDTDIYVMPADGGRPERVTHHPTNESLQGWIGDDELLFFAGNMADHPFESALFRVSVSGGMPERLPVAYGARGAIDPTGTWLAFTPNTRDNATWKRYRGGDATDVWLFHLADRTSRRVTDFEGTDTAPMWHGSMLYYLSDRGSNHKLNLWSYDLDRDRHQQITDHGDYDVKWPSVGPGDAGQGEIVYQLGPDLMLLDLGTGDSRRVVVRVPGDRAAVAPRLEQTANLISSRDLSPSAKRVVVSARGDLWTLPRKNGPAVALTRTSGVAELAPAWSLDGRWIAYLSDEAGEYDVYVTQSDGKGETRRVADLDPGYFQELGWSPDGAWITLWDQVGWLLLCNVDSGEVRRVAQHIEGARSTIRWSPDSRWIAYANGVRESTPGAIHLYDVENDQDHQVTRGMFADTWPTFDREGKYLYFASQREFTDPIYSDYGISWIYNRTDRLYVVPLREDVPSPFLAENDVEEWEDEDADGEGGDAGAEDGEGDDAGDENGGGDDDGDDTDDGGADEDGDADEEDEIEPVEIDLEGFEARAIELPVDRGGFFDLAVNDAGHLLYTRLPAAGTDDPRTINIFDPEADDDEHEKEVVAASRFTMTPDGTSILVITSSGGMAILDAKAGQSIDETVDTDGLRVWLEPAEEWEQIFTEAWRLVRDYFYVENLHGLDWDAVRDRYQPMIDHCVTRRDVQYVLGEMIGELNVGHSYLWGSGDLETNGPSVSVGLLGCDFELDAGAYRISRIYRGADWDTHVRNPLDEPGLDVSEGDYLLAVNGTPVDPAVDPWAPFVGLAGETVVLTVSERPELDDEARDVPIETLGWDWTLRYYDWMERNRARVEEATDGRVGYIHVVNTGIQGQNELNRQFYGQLHLDGLIIDERWNGGGQIPSRFIELLNRPVTNYWARRIDKEDAPWPPDSHQGPKCMLINGSAGSGGDHFPWLFRWHNLGKLIGTRTWGGLVGISGSPGFIDGGAITVPTFGIYETDGTWAIEGHGTDPDIEVIADPEPLARGVDPQLERGIEHMKREIERNPYRWPGRPAPPDRSGMGIRDEDR